jgi:adenylate cyclase
MARILLVSPEGQQVVELRDHNSLGRHPSNTVQLLDKIVSKEHCIIERRPNGFTLRDLGSLNGTYVNGERVAGERDLRHGDDIALGQTRARYDDGSGRPMPAPPGYSPAAGGAFQPQHAPQSGWQQSGPASMGAPSTVGAPGGYGAVPQPMAPLGIGTPHLSPTPAIGFQPLPLQGQPPGAPTVDGAPMLAGPDCCQPDCGAC